MLNLLNAYCTQLLVEDNEVETAVAELNLAYAELKASAASDINDAQEVAAKMMGKSLSVPLA